MADEVNSGDRAGRHAARVARTEAQLMDAAQALFLRQGYVSTSLAQVAQQAGLAARTVYVRFGTKANLFRRVVDRALVGDTQPIAVADRPGMVTAMTAATLPERIGAFADVCVALAERAGPLFEVAAQAEAVEPEIAAAARAGRDATLTLCTRFWRQAARDGLLRDGLEPKALAVVTDLLVSADSTVHLRRTGAWSARGHRRLVVNALSALARPSAPDTTQEGAGPTAAGRPSGR